MKVTKTVSTTLGWMCLSVALPVFAQAPVSDLGMSQRRVEVNEGYSSESASRSNDMGSNNAGAAVSASDSGSMFRQMQQLQEEVATLRGQLEEQANALQKLKQQQQDDFTNLDGRIAGGSTGAAGANNNSHSSDAGNLASMPSASAASNAAANTSDGKEEYEAAYALLKGKDYDGAATAFKSFAGKYPNSDYTGSSWFWLGFIYQTKGDMDSAAKSFASLIEHFPQHAKVDDAKYNLGKIYHQQGKNDQARTLLKEVASGSSKSAPLAKSYLESM